MGNNILYFPSFYEETSIELGHGTTDCETLETNCGEKTVSDCGKPSYFWGENCFTTYSGIQDRCTCTQKNQYLVAGLTKQNMTMYHSYEDMNPTTSPQVSVSGKSSDNEARVAEKVATSSAAGSKIGPIMSVIMTFDTTTNQYKEFDCNKPSSGQCRFKPGEDVSLSIGNWARAAGIVGSENAQSVNPTAAGAGQNGYADKEIKDPLLRVTGAEIRVSIAYYDSYFQDDNLKDALEGYEDGILAKIQVRAEADWTSSPQIAHGGLAYSHQTSGFVKQRERYYYGIRFVFLGGTGGRFGYLSWMLCLSFGAVLAVYIGLVGKFMKFLLTKMLGDTSRNYLRAQQDTFNIDRDAQQTAPARVLMATAAFHALCNENKRFTKQINGETHLTYAAVLNSFKSIFAKRLDSSMIEKMAHIVFYSIASDEKFGNEKDVGTGMAAQMFKQEKEQSVFVKETKGGEFEMDEPLGIDADSFVAACLRNDVLDLPALANLFDPTDEKGFIEGIFGERGMLRHRLLKEEAYEGLKSAVDSQRGSSANFTTEDASEGITNSEEQRKTGLISDLQPAQPHPPTSPDVRL